MSTEAEKSQLLEEFKVFLEQDTAGQIELDKQPDLNLLLSELTALKTEVKTESRQFKNTLDNLSSALASVQDDNKSLSTELALSSERMAQQQAELMRTMLLEFVDIYDRLATGRDILQNYQPVKSLFKKSRKKDVHLIARFNEGQVMTLQRFEQLLLQYQVRPIDCVGNLLDPLTMSAVETGNDPQQENGMVLEELRRGFLFQDQVLRLAEVKVNKINLR